MKRKRLTQKQGIFAIKYFELGNAAEAARLAGYSQKSIRNIASVNLTKANIQARLEELNKKAMDASVMNVLERKQRLSEIARARSYNVKVVNPLQAIDLLNKMDRIYSEGPEVNIDNRRIEIIVQTERAKELTERILRGEET